MVLLRWFIEIEAVNLLGQYEDDDKKTTNICYKLLEIILFTIFFVFYNHSRIDLRDLYLLMKLPYLLHATFYSCEIIVYFNYWPGMPCNESCTLPTKVSAFFILRTPNSSFIIFSHSAKSPDFKFPLIRVWKTNSYFRVFFYKLEISD